MNPEHEIMSREEADAIRLSTRKYTPEEISDALCKACRAAAITSKALIEGLSAMTEMLSKQVQDK